MPRPTDLNMKKQRTFDDGWGFNKYALKIAMAMAGYEPTITQVARLLHCSYRQAEWRMMHGKFTRHDIAVLHAKLRLDGDQLVDIFFNGRYPSYMNMKNEDHEWGADAPEEPEEGGVDRTEEK